MIISLVMRAMRTVLLTDEELFVHFDIRSLIISGQNAAENEKAVLYGMTQYESTEAVRSPCTSSLLPAFDDA